MGTVPTDTLERRLRQLYLRWLAQVPQHSNDLSSYIDEFKESSLQLINEQGSKIARLGALIGAPTPQMIDLSPVAGYVYDDMKLAGIKAGIAAGLGSKDIARQMLNTGLDKSYKNLERLARTEVVSAFWAQQWDSVAGLDMDLVWSVERSARTCVWCLSKDGMVVKDKSLRDHPNGRCTLIPQMHSVGYTSPNPLDEQTIPKIKPPVTETGKFFKSAWTNSYSMTSYWRSNYMHPNGDALPQGSYPAANKGHIPKTLDKFMSSLALDFHPLSKDVYVWRTETSSIFDKYPIIDGYKVLTAPTATSVKVDQAVERLGTSAVGNDFVTMYSLLLPKDLARVMAGQSAENELIVLAGSRIKVVSETLEKYQGKVVRMVRGIVYPPVVGDVYYGVGTYTVD